ncbi:hypothetical protein SK1NUM_27900 [Arachnia rubra]|nr:hypothetical protein SK1NUM_27900 [Arachnia rubra]
MLAPWHPGGVGRDTSVMVALQLGGEDVFADAAGTLVAAPPGADAAGRIGAHDVLAVVALTRNTPGCPAKDRTTPVDTRCFAFLRRGLYLSAHPASLGSSRWK